MKSIEMLETPESFLNHNATSNGQRDGLKIRKIGQSAGKTQAYIKHSHCLEKACYINSELTLEIHMADHIEDTDSGIYRITREGKVFTQTKRKIPLVGKGMEFLGEFKFILEPEREMTYTLNNRGYLSVVVRRKTHMLHRLVAQAFIPNPEGKPFVNHKDGDKQNNHVDNLEWYTAAENNQHARITGLHKQAKGHKVNYKNAASKQRSLNNLKDKSKLTPDEVRYVRRVHKARSKEFSATALAERFGTSLAAMCKIVKGQSYADIE